MVPRNRPLIPASAVAKTPDWAEFRIADEATIEFAWVRYIGDSGPRSEEKGIDGRMPSWYSPEPGGGMLDIWNGQRRPFRYEWKPLLSVCAVVGARWCQGHSGDGSQAHQRRKDARIPR